MSRLLILGAGGHAKVVAETALASGVASSLAFLDDRCMGPDPWPPVLGWPVMGPLALSMQAGTPDQFDAAVVAIGHAAKRLHWIQHLRAVGYHLPVLIHPTAWVSPSAQLCPASVVFAHAVVQAQASIGMGAILNTGCSIDHDAQLADGVHICPGAHLAGAVNIGARSWIGIGASVIQRVRIGSDVTVGAGAAVVRDLPDCITAVGVPARVIAPTNP
jgi:sugar O-acyltransferase (sialic acid O-acetyltransferase NeuD family)